MKKHYSLLTAIFIMIAFIVVASCEKNVSNAGNNKASASNSSNASASAITSNDKVPTTIQLLIPCANNGAGEIIDLAGSLHVVFHTTVNGNNFVSKYHYQPQGISGNGETTGEKYNATGETQEVIKGSFTNGQFVDSYVDNFKIVGQRSGNNYLVHENLHITVNADGTVTASVNHITSDCK